jgi:sugar phosphate isomerase/epimerase
MRDYTRRDFIGTAAVGAAAFVAGSTQMLAGTGKKIPIGVQLYSVRNVFSRDVPGTLAGIKKIGYEGVEFAGYASFNNDAKGLRKLLDDNGLKCCGTHLQGGLRIVTGDALAQTVEFNEIIGNDKLVVPSLQARTAADWLQNAETFSEIAEKLKPNKMRIGYHNHTAEFTAIEGKMPTDIFFGKASPEVFVQLDIGHCFHAGADPAAYLKKYLGRVLTVHAKDYSAEDRAGDVVGAGKVKWAEVLPVCQDASSSVQWYIVEEESNAFQGLDGIEKSFQGLQKLLA